MKILVAVPDRDLLSAIKRLLELGGDDAVSSFDGIMAIDMLAKGGFDAAVIDANIPRADVSAVVGYCIERNVRTVVLTYKSVNTSQLLNDCIASSYLQYPFEPSKLTVLIRNVVSKSSDPGYDNGKIRIRNCILNNRIRLTNEEEELIISLSDGGGIPEGCSSVYIRSADKKLALSGTGAHIAYIMNEGYKMVFDHE